MKLKSAEIGVPARDVLVLEKDAAPPARVARMLRRMEVLERVALSSSHVDRLVREGRFPKYVPLSGSAVGLPEHVLDAFLAERMAARPHLRPLGCRPRLPLWHYDATKVPSECGIRLLRRWEVVPLVGVSETTMYELIPQNRFPAQVSLGPWASRWVAHEIDAWICGETGPVPDTRRSEPAAPSRLSM